MIRGATGADLIPVTRDLPEGLDRERFQREFGAVDSPRYTRLVQEIDRRIEALPLYSGQF